MSTDVRTSANIEATSRIYEAVPAGDAATVFALLDPEIVITYYGNDEIPYAGTFSGVEGATDFFTRVGESVEIVSMEPQRFIADGDHLASFGHQVFRARATGREFASNFAHVIELRDGKWLRFHDFMNSALAAEAFRA